MKNINYYVALLLATFLWSCGQDVVYTLPDGDKFNNLYLLQATEQPRTTMIFMVKDEQAANYSAYYSGMSAPNDIHITFEIDTELVAEYNQAYQTNYRVMPEGSYELVAKEAVIPAGQTRTGLMKLKLYSYGYIYIEAFEQYLLPLKMKTNDVKVNEELNVIYYQISASYEPGNVPFKEVYPDIIDSRFFSYHDKCLLAKNDAGDILRYAYNTTTETFDAPTTIQTGWGGNVTIVPGGANTIQTLGFLEYGGSIITYQCNENGTSLPAYGNYSSVIFGGLGTNYQPVGNGNHDGLLMVNNGRINYYGLNSSWTAYAGPQVITEYDVNIYKSIFFYGLDLVGISESGDMWIHKFSSSGHNFSASPSRIGSGWDDFTHVTAFGTHILARDTNGKLRLYEFDVRGFWALK